VLRETSAPLNRADRPAHTGILNRVGRNFGWLAASTGVSAVASLVYVGLAARTLGPRGFGSFALVMTYGELMTNLAQFQSWKAVVGFGASHWRTGNSARLARLSGFAASLDWLGAVIGALAAFAGSILLGPLLGWTATEARAAAWFATALLVTSGTAAAGLLRLFDRFDLQAYSEALAQAARLAGCAIGWFEGLGVFWFLGVWAVAALFQFIAQWVAVFLLRHRTAFHPRALRLAPRENRGLLPFMLKTNVSGSLSLVWMQCGTLVVGIRAGPVEAGGFRLASRLAQAIMQPVEIGAKSLFPELARLVAEGDRVTTSRVLVRVSAVAAVFGTVAVVLASLFGRNILSLIAGPRFGFAEDFLFLLSIAAAVSVAGFALEPFLNANLRAGAVLRAQASAAILYGVLIYMLLPGFGAMAAAFASIAAALIVTFQLGVSAVGFLAGRLSRRGNIALILPRAEVTDG